jgi:uncharacterized protein
MRILPKEGADPKLTTKDGNNALPFAAGVGYRDKQTKGSDADALEALKMCTDQGLDIGQTNGKGESALHGAANRGSDVLVKFLVEHGAKLVRLAGSLQQHRGIASKSWRRGRSGELTESQNRVIKPPT